MFTEAARTVREAEAFVITAGAGMGVDSGLPDFRGDHGFWQGLSTLCTPGAVLRGVRQPGTHFTRDPPSAGASTATGTNLYRDTIRHAGCPSIHQALDRPEQAPITLW